MDAWITNITYKPHFSFGLYQCTFYKTYSLRVYMLVPDVRDMTKMVRVHHEKHFTNPVTEDEFYQAAFEVVSYMETHEAKEQFRVKGLQLHNPHAEGT